MELYHKVVIPKFPRRYDHGTLFSMWGSCFSTESATYLTDRLFSVIPSPFGIMYNPSSMARGMNILFEGKEFSADDLFLYEGMWHSNMHHGAYSGIERDEVLEHINDALRRLRESMSGVDVWVFTFGTAYVYEESTPPYGVVNNCHRRPASDFSRRRLTVDEIVREWHPIISRLRSDGCDVIFTVSPICHYRDGAHDNRLSKATLHLAIDELMRLCPGTLYFPSYEIMCDELRDYRFYAPDMSHPSPLAVEYIMERFAESCIDRQATEALSSRWTKLRRRLSHRPLTKDKERLVRHYEELLGDLTLFLRDHPHELVRQAITEVQSAIRQLP